MKKGLLLILMISLFIFTGCKKYDTIEEYSVAMKEVRTRLNSYTIEAEVSDNGNMTYYKGYMNGQNWKTEELTNDKKTYYKGILYDGKEVWTYTNTKTSAVQVPFRLMLAMQGIGSHQNSDMIMKIINPLGILVNWSLSEYTGEVNEDAWDFAGMKNFNGFRCRMIENMNNEDSVCVSDKYGIAVYAKIKGKDDNYTEYNVKSISNRALTQQDMDLPEGIKKISISGIFQDLLR